MHGLTFVQSAYGMNPVLPCIVNEVMMDSSVQCSVLGSQQHQMRQGHCKEFFLLGRALRHMFRVQITSCILLTSL
jgi:hypothetical protein